MKFLVYLRSAAAALVVFCLLAAAPLSAATAFDKKGEKNFKQGMKYEIAQQWDRAAEEFALAVAANPGNPEFRLHYVRALFNASQMMMQRGRTLAEQKDYVGAYNAFRQAYGYDPVNELAKSEMDRMVRLQQGEAPQGERQNDLPKDGTNTPPQSPPAAKLVPTAYNASGAPAQQMQDAPQVEQLRDIKFTKVDLKNVIKQLAQDLDLNVLFDTETFRSQRDTTIELRNVSTAQALDYIFQQEGLFFQRVGKRTIMVASQIRRQNFQQLVLKTFYLANAKPGDVQKVLQQAIPAQPGRPPTIAIIDEATNSLTVRDTSENIKLIGRLIRSLDKDRAEVVMDVNIYEVSKNDLLQLGTQIGTAGSLVNLGGTTSGVIGVGGNDIYGRTLNTAAAAGTTAATVVGRAFGAGILLPAATIQALQSKDNTKLLASTQVHAFNNEESQTRIGRRVPVRTAQLLGYNQTPGQPQNTGFGQNAADVINYEQVGLTLKFTPIVFPNQDVQVKMSIESKDVTGNGGLTPSFSERSISGTARVQNNRTLLLASVAQDTQSNGRTGLPILGSLPIIGRLFTAPTKNNQQVDIVIAVTPRVLRAPNILPEDESERETGSLSNPTNSSVAELLRREDIEDRFENSRRVPNTATVQLPDQPIENAPAYVPANSAGTAVVAAPQNQTASAPNAVPVSQPAVNQLPAVTPRPIDSSVETLTVSPTVDDAAPALKPPAEETTKSSEPPQQQPQ